MSDQRRESTCPSRSRVMGRLVTSSSINRAGSRRWTDPPSARSWHRTRCRRCPGNTAARAWRWNSPLNIRAKTWDKTMKRLLTFATLLLLPVHLAVSQQGRIETQITEGAKTVRVAIPLFQPTSTGDNSTKLAQLFNQVLWDDLDFTGNL